MGWDGMEWNEMRREAAERETVSSLVPFFAVLHREIRCNVVLEIFLSVPALYLH